MKRKAQVTLYFTFIIVGIIIILIGAVAAPLGVLFSTKMYSAGEDILNQANESLEQIQNPTVKAQIADVIHSAQDASLDNITVAGGLYEYSWIFLLVISALVVFIATRRLIEFSGGSGFI